jgi:hypothetical protein
VCYARSVIGGRAIAFSLALAAATACGGPDFTRGRPKIVSVSQPLQTEAFALEFTVQFLDVDADLGGGSIHVVIDDQETNMLGLAEVFAAQSPPIANDTAQGQFDIVVRLSPSVRAGDTIKIGFFLLDAKGEKSNVPYVVLQAAMTGG